MSQCLVLFHKNKCLIAIYTQWKRRQEAQLSQRGRAKPRVISKLCLLSSWCCILVYTIKMVTSFLYLLVIWAWWDWQLTWLTDHCHSVLWHCWLGHMTCKIVSELTYNVSSGTLNPTIPYHIYLASLSAVHSWLFRVHSYCWECSAVSALLCRTTHGQTDTTQFVANFTPISGPFWQFYDEGCNSFPVMLK